MSDTRFEREQSALEKQPLPVRSRLEVIGHARSILEAMAPRFEQPVQVETPKIVPLDLVAQVEADQAESVKVLTDIESQKAIAEVPVTSDAEATDGLDAARRLVEKSYEAA